MASKTVKGKAAKKRAVKTRAKAPKAAEHPVRRGPKPQEGYDERAANRALQAKKRAAARDIEIPECVNPKRRSKAAKSLLAFAMAYFSRPPSLRYPGMPAWFSLEPGDVHLEFIEAFERICWYGGQEAWAAPRGAGKDTILKIGAMWAALNGHKWYPLLGAFKLEMSERMLRDIKSQLEVNDWLHDDYPEVCAPVRALEQSALRARTQTVNGQPTRMEWGSRYIVLPTIEGSLASGRIIGTGSVNGAIRGENVGSVRPDLVALTDPQTRDVAKNPTQVKEVMDLIRQDFGGLSSNVEPLAALALVTVIRKNDVADRLTDRRRHPEWNGRKHVAIKAWPERMDLWNQYEELKRDGQEGGEDPTGRAAHTFYLENREEMDRGAVTYWPPAYIKHKAPDGSQLESSQLEHLMNERYTMGHEGFMAEFQNDPVEEGVDSSGLTVDVIQHRQSQYQHLIVPDDCVKLTQGVDIRDRELHYVTVAWTNDATGFVIDYAIVEYSMLVDDDLHGRPGLLEPLDKVVLSELRRLRGAVVASPYRRIEGLVAEVDLSVVDSGHRKTAVYQFVRESGPRWIAAKGMGRGQGQERFHRPQAGEGRSIGQYWYGAAQPERLMLWHLDADHWKTHVHEGLIMAPGAPGSLSLFRAEPKVHKTLANHLLAETWYVDKQQWVREHRQNHFFDCLYMACAAADMLGIRRLSAEPLGVQRASDTPSARVLGRVKALDLTRGRR